MTYAENRDADFSKIDFGILGIFSASEEPLKRGKKATMNFGKCDLNRERA